MNEQYNKKLIPLARSLRKNMTPEEKRLWYLFLKDLDITIKRQQVIGDYIVDFCCPSKMLVIELDGSQHYENEENQRKDTARDEYLTSLGYTVKRYLNRDIHWNFNAVCSDIHYALFNCDVNESKPE